MTQEILSTRYNILIIYLFAEAAMVAGVLGIGVGLPRVSVPLAALAIVFSFVATSLASSRVLFTSVELNDGYVRLRAPFYRLTILQSDVVAVNLRRGPSGEDAKSVWRQVAMLKVFLNGGRRIVLGMLDVTTLRAIASHLQRDVFRSRTSPGEPQ